MNGTNRLVATELPAPAGEPATGTPLVAGREPGGLERWLGFVLPVGLLALWEVAVRAGWLSRLFFPAPSVVLQTLVHLTANGELPRHLAISLQRIGWGLLLGAVPGLALGLAMGWIRSVRRLLDPLVSALYPVPRLALFPLIMMMFGVGEMSKIIIIAIGVFFPTLINAMAGVRAIHEVYFEVALSYGARPWNIFTRVVLPGSLPLAFAGLRLALGLSLLLVIGIEFIAARTGLGAFLLFAWETFKPEYVYVGLLVSALLGAAFTGALRVLEHRLLPWSEGLFHG